MGLPSSKNAVPVQKHMGVCQRVPKQQVVRKHRSRILVSQKSPLLAVNPA